MKFQAGDYVEWKCNRYLSNHSIVCRGRIISIKETTFGACKKALGAKIGCLENYPYKDRSTTTVALDKLKLV